MKKTIEISEAFTLEDIRKLRNDFTKRYMDKSGKIDWDGANAEMEEGAKRTRAEIMRLRTKRIG